MENKFDLRTKTYILFLIFSIFQVINLFQSLWSYHPVQLNLIILGIITILIFLIPLIFLILNTKKSKRFGWGISIIIFLIMFFYLLYTKINNYPANQLINSYSLNANLAILASFVSIVIVYAVSELKNFKNKLFDKWISYTFIFICLILPSLISVFYTISQIYSQYRILNIIQYLSTPIVYLIILWIWIKAEKNKSIGKFDLRTKIFILLFLIPSTFSIPESIFLWRISPRFVISAIFYLISLIIILCYEKEKRKIAWMIGVIPSLITLFNPLQSPFNPGAYQGTILSLFQYIKYGDIVTALLMLVGSVIPVLIIIFAVTEIMNYKKNNFDKKIGIFFLVFYFIRPAIEKLIKGLMSVDFSIEIGFITNIFTSLITNITRILFIAALFLWIYLENKEK